MLLFVILAATLILIAISFVAIPLLRGGTNAPWAALGCIVVLMLGSVGLYATWSNWSWSSGPAADTPAGMVSRLARRLEREPGDLNGWLMLGRSYAAMSQTPLALRAYERADRLADEVGKAGRVDQVDARAVDLAMQERGTQRVLVLLL